MTFAIAYFVRSSFASHNHRVAFVKIDHLNTGGPKHFSVHFTLIWKFALLNGSFRDILLCSYDKNNIQMKMNVEN